MRLTRVLGFVLVAAILAVWELAARTGALDPRFVPPPSAIAAAWVGYAASGALLTDLLGTLGSWAQGYAIAAVLGVTLGVAMGLLPVRRHHSHRHRALRHRRPHETVRGDLRRPVARADQHAVRRAGRRPHPARYRAHLPPRPPAQRPACHPARRVALHRHRPAHQHQ